MTAPGTRKRKGHGGKRRGHGSGKAPQRSDRRWLLGGHATTEAIRSGTRIHRLLLADPVTHSGSRIMEALAEQSGEPPPVRHLPYADLDELLRQELPGGDDASLKHQGVAAQADPLTAYGFPDLFPASRPFPLFLCLDQITDPHNLGAMIRSAVALGTDGILMPERRSAPISEVVGRTSAGAIEHARLVTVTNLAQTLLRLQDEGVECCGLAADGDISLGELSAPPAGGRALVVGSEGTGLRRLVRERCDMTVRIPMEGPIDSLNASTAASIALYACHMARTPEQDGS